MREVCTTQEGRGPLVARVGSEEELQRLNASLRHGRWVWSGPGEATFEEAVT
jgi:hypothetical protein